MKHAHADDFGLDSSANNAILALLDDNHLDSLSLVTNLRGFTQAASNIPSLNVDVFLHFNITEGKPLSAARSVPSLIDDDGNFYNQKEMMKRCIRGAIEPNDVLDELQAQYRQALKAGTKIVGIDSHQHMHAFSPIAQVVVDFAESHNIQKVRSYKRVVTIGPSAIFIKTIYALLARVSGRGRLPVTWQISSWRSYIMATWQDTRTYTGDVLVVVHPGTDYDRKEPLTQTLRRHFSHIKKK